MGSHQDGSERGRVIDGEYREQVRPQADDAHSGSRGSGANRPDAQQGEGMALAVYILYLIALFTGVAALVGVVLAYIFRDDAQTSWLASHYRFLIRTFWVGLLYAVIAMILMAVLIGWLLMLVLLVWVVVRCALGIRDLLGRRAVPNPGTWGFY